MDELSKKLAEHESQCPICGNPELMGDDADCPDFRIILRKYSDIVLDEDSDD